MEVKDAIFSTIQHYHRMISWVEKQPPEDKVVSIIMLGNIGEDWGGKYCTLCKLYNTVYTCSSVCPLDCCKSGSLWRLVNNSPTWSEWLKHAKNLREFLIKQLKIIKGR